jgi:hypothetical protein
MAAPVAAGDPPSADTREIRDELRGTGVRVDTKKPLPPTSQGDDSRPPKLGDQRVFLALDDVAGQFYLKFFTLRGMNKDAEVWVANNLNFPAGDCRNDGVRNVITNSQIAYLLQQHSSIIKPIDTAWFGNPAVRRGDGAPLVDLLNDIGLPTHKNAYRNPAGRDLVLIDNVRDDNFFDTNNANTLPRIAGFFSQTISFYTQRNVMTIDSWDWIHGTGANPPHEPSPDPCLTASANPFLYEGVFAHEYQHLIHADYDPDETSWVNEGMSDLAMSLTGYVDPSAHIDEIDGMSHILGYLGWLSVPHPDWNPFPDDTGPENSLTVWEDQPNPAEIFEDYGFAYFFMLYMQSHGYDQSFFTAWHHNGLNSIEGLNATLASVGSSDTFDSLLRDLAVSVLADAYLDAGAPVTGASAADLQIASTNATIFFNANGDANATPGAPPYGSDYIELGAGSSLTSLDFAGDAEFAFPGGPEWIVDPNGYWTTPDGAGAPYAPNSDASIAREVTAGASDQLTFEHYYQTENSWDFGFVQVSTDSGMTWMSLPCSGTTDQHNPAADPAIAANMPGYTGPDETGDAYVGSEGAPVAATCDLPDGTFLLAFRFMSDPLVEFDGWHVRNVQIGGTAVDVTPGDLSDWDNQAFFNPLEFGWMVQLVGLSGTVDGFGHVTSAGTVAVVRPTLVGGNTWSTTDFTAVAGSTRVVAIITALTPEDDQDGTYAPYSLMVNGVEMADGGP